MAKVPIRRTGPGGQRITVPPTEPRPAPPAAPPPVPPPASLAAPPAPALTPAAPPAPALAPVPMPARPPAPAPAAPPARGGSVADLLAHRAREAGKSVAWELLYGSCELVQSAIGIDAHTAAEILRSIAEELDPPAPPAPPAPGA